MTKKITNLTPEQEARFPEFVRKWIDIGLSTAPADRERAERAIAGLYDLAKLRRPRVIWLPCPISAALSAEAKLIDDSGSDDVGQLIELKLPGLSQPGRFLKARCPRNGLIVEGVPRISDIDGLPIETAIAAQAWRIGDPQSEYAHPPVRT